MCSEWKTLCVGKQYLVCEYKQYEMLANNVENTELVVEQYEINLESR